MKVGGNRSKQDDIMASLAKFIATIIRALAMPMRWCRKTGMWVVDHAAKAAMVGIEATSDLITGTADIAGRTAKWAGDLTGKVASLPGALIGGFLGGTGGGGGGIPHPARKEQRAKKDVQTALNALRARRKNAGLAGVMSKSQQIVDGSSLMRRHQEEMGEIVHAYAKAGSIERFEIDLDPLPQHVRRWLLTRSEKDLQRLAAAGLEKCGLAAMGKRTGLIGLELPAKPDAATYNQELGCTPEIEARVLTDMGARGVLGARIARAKGTACGMRPVH
jgi:hypothetical protein